MGRMQIVLPKELEQLFREKAAQKFGYKKGNISMAIAEAITEWLKR